MRRMSQGCVPGNMPEAAEKGRTSGPTPAVENYTVRWGFSTHARRRLCLGPRAARATPRPRGHPLCTGEGPFSYSNFASTVSPLGQAVGACVFQQHVKK